METTITKAEMIINFFNNHRTGTYTTQHLTNYLMENYDFSKKVINDGRTLQQTLLNEVASVMSEFYTDQKKWALRNFSRTQNKNSYIYRYLPNNNHHKQEPQPIETENPTTTEQTPIPITNDPIQMIIDFYKNIDLKNIDDFNFSSIRDNKKITINITNL
jgi:hypothetical protein